MKLSRPDLAAYVVVALCVLVTGVLAAVHVPVPDFVQYVAVTALGIGGGVALQGAAPAPAQEILPSTSSSSAPAPANLPVAAPYPPAVGTTSDPAATGVFRAVTHAP